MMVTNRVGPAATSANTICHLCQPTRGARADAAGVAAGVACCLSPELASLASDERRRRRPPDAAPAASGAEAPGPAARSSEEDMECGGETGPAECTGPACWESRALGPVVVCTQCCSSVPSEPTSCWVACVSSSLSRVSSSSRRAASGVSPEGDITLVYPHEPGGSVTKRQHCLSPFLTRFVTYSPIVLGHQPATRFVRFSTRFVA